MPDDQTTQILVAIARLDGKMDAFKDTVNALRSDHDALRKDVDDLKLADARGAGFVSGGKFFWSLVVGMPGVATGIAALFFK